MKLVLFEGTLQLIINEVIINPSSRRERKYILSQICVQVLNQFVFYLIKKKDKFRMMRR